MTLRAYCSADLEAILRLFYESVHAIGREDYTPEQLDAWAPPPEELDKNGWGESLSAHCALVAETEGQLIGFADLEEPGYFDRLYVHPAYQRRGVAGRLAAALERRAAELGAREITVHASITARPFFEQRGYTVERAQTVVRRGMALTNFVMRKGL